MVRYCVDVQLHTCSHCHAIKGFYDKNGKTSYNCLAAVDYREKFRYLGVFSGSNSDQGMWNHFNFHLSSTRILVECVFGKLKGRFKVLHGVTDRHSHDRNARMICTAAVLHNMLIDIGDNIDFGSKRDDESRRKARQAMNAFDRHWERTNDEISLGEAKRNAYMERFFCQDNE
ncbi:Hypothetical protein PHPALM_19301 [Phytophthora palmivora]|uniref:DDE Tnp4 domain-containing protein n=1 Tax=Phytophthora palmivora TaxID=4796 RepID=A0A2P4XHN8_9STRA|nr:Hypothetical protein PHPALM_19301 [Phytophthora palmivora]